MAWLSHSRRLFRPQFIRQDCPSVYPAPSTTQSTRQDCPSAYTAPSTTLHSPDSLNFFCGLTLTVQKCKHSLERKAEKPQKRFNSLSSHCHTHSAPPSQQCPASPAAVQDVFCDVGRKHALMDVPFLNKKDVRKTSCQPSSVPATHIHKLLSKSSYSTTQRFSTENTRVTYSNQRP